LGADTHRWAQHTADKSPQAQILAWQQFSAIHTTVSRQGLH